MSPVWTRRKRSVPYRVHLSPVSLARDASGNVPGHRKDYTQLRLWSRGDKECPPFSSLPQGFLALPQSNWFGAKRNVKRIFLGAHFDQ